MDDITNHTFSPNKYPIPITDLIPHAIISDSSAQRYRISFAPSPSGIILSSPRLVSKQDLSRLHPHLIRAWESKIRDEKQAANEQEEAFVDLAGHVLGRKDPNMTAQRGVNCDQKLLPGMAQHWGELRKCETHPKGRPESRVCKGCRVAHYTLENRGFDRKIIMARGARVPVCAECATRAVAEHGVGHRGCRCDSRWSCYRCREEELRRLAKAREGYAGEYCEGCGEVGDLVRNVEFCLGCQGWRVYAESGDDG